MPVNNISEANLNLRELSVGSADGLRGDTLVAMIRDGRPLRVAGKGGAREITVANAEQVLQAITGRDGSFSPERAARYFTMPDAHKRYRPDAIVAADGGLYKLNDLEKTADFGSSGGSGLGSRDTRYVESVACVFMAWRQLKRSDLDEGDFDDIAGLPEESYADFLSRYTSLDPRMGLTRRDIATYWEGWSDTFIHLPNFLYRDGIVGSGYKNENLLDPRRIYRFCQLAGDAGPVSALRAAFRDRHPGVNFAKWNPSDIFAVEKGAEEQIQGQLEKCTTAARLNEIVDRAFESRQMVGISLKKVKRGEDIKVVVNKVTRPPRYRLSTVRFSRDPLATLGLEVIAERKSREFGHGTEVMVIRSRDSSKMINISAEVKGKTAKHGNMSLTQINKILDSYGLERVPGVGPRAEQHYKDSIEEWSDAVLRREIKAINQKLLNHYDTVVEPRAGAAEPDRMRMVSKYQALFLAWVLMEAQDYLSDRDGYTLADRVVEDMFHFALSINITPGRESGRTPRYARIVD